jgi:glyoxylase-like metal-dependent hydrolase (beta-lactamase superfamily II)
VNETEPRAGCTRRRFLGLSAMALLTGCTAHSHGSVSGARVGRYASPNPGSVNTLWLFAPDGLIVIDSGRNVTGGRRAAAAMIDTGLPVRAIVITHPHPDHVGGLGVLRDAFPKAPIYASKATADWMRTNPLGFYQLARRDDPDFPAELTFPDHLLAPGEHLEVAGARLETADFGPGESETATAFYEPTTGAVFAGDIVSNHFTPALLEGHTCGWLANLDALERRFPRAVTIHPGHGEPADAKELIGQQRDYLTTFRNTVQPAVSDDSAEGGKITQAEQADILAKIDQEYPDHPRVASLSTLKQVNVQAVGGELRGKNSATCGGS